MIKCFLYITQYVIIYFIILRFVLYTNNCTGVQHLISMVSGRLVDIVVMSRGEWYDDNVKRTIPQKQGIPSYLYSFTYTFKISVQINNYYHLSSMKIQILLYILFGLLTIILCLCDVRSAFTFIRCFVLFRVRYTGHRICSLFFHLYFSIFFIDRIIFAT